MACIVCQKTFVLATEDEFDSDAKPHVCSTCGQSFSLKIQLRRHSLLHVNGEPFTCINCSKESQKDESKCYNLRLAKKGDYFCEDCNASFFSKRMLLKHTNDEHKFESSYFCDDCPEIFETSADLKKHAATHKSVFKKRTVKTEASDGHASKGLFCPSCLKSFAYQACLDKHIKMLKCKSLDPVKSSSKKRALDVDDFIPSKISKTNEDVSESNSKKHSCNVCRKSFTRKSALEGHELLHLKDDYDSPDEDTEEAYVSENDSDNYVSEPKINIRQSFMCEKCNFVCFSNMTLKRHVERNHQERKDPETQKDQTSNACSKCTERFSSVEELEKHNLVHVGEESDIKPKLKVKKEKGRFPCSVCERVFSSAKRLTRHKWSHDPGISDLNEINRKSGGKKIRSKDYFCEVCGKRFAGETCFKKHSLKHEEGRDEGTTKVKKKKQKVSETLTCSFCSEEFVGRKGAYVKHMHAHTPEVCGICDERFVDRQSLREHCKVHVGTEEGKMFMECSQKALDAKNGLLPPEPKVEYIYLVLR